MRVLRPALAAILLATSASVPVHLRAQTTARPSEEELKSRLDRHRGDFDYLLGDWEFTAQSKEWGALKGVWSAVRLDQGQILDEYRITGDSGETYYVTTTIRAYNAPLDRWELIGMDGGGGLQDFGTAKRVGSEMHLEQKFGVAAGAPSWWRIRYHAIQADRFSWSADRSRDGGKTWERDHQTIQARRAGPARALGALAVAKKPK
jgi:hypothetical protein